MANRTYLCLAHMSGNEMKYIQEAFDTNWVVPLGPNVNAFEDELARFVKSVDAKKTLMMRITHSAFWRIVMIRNNYGLIAYPVCRTRALWRFAPVRQPSIWR